MRICAKCAAPLPVETGRGARRKMCAACSPSRPRRKPDPPRLAVEAATAPVGCVLDATRAALVQSGQVASPMGQAALVLARRIDDGDEPLAAITQATKQLQAALASVVGVEQSAPADPNDEFTRKRLAREHGA